MTMSCILHSFRDREDQEIEVRVSEFPPETKHAEYWLGLNIGPVTLATDRPELLDEIATAAMRYAQKLRDVQAAAKAANPHADKSMAELVDEMKSIPLS